MDLVGVRNVNVLVRPSLPQAVFVPHQAGRQHQDQRDTESCGTIAPGQVDRIEGQHDDGGPHRRANEAGSFVDQGQ